LPGAGYEIPGPLGLGARHLASASASAGSLADLEKALDMPGGLSFELGVDAYRLQRARPGQKSKSTAQEQVPKGEAGSIVERAAFEHGEVASVARLLRRAAEQMREAHPMGPALVLFRERPEAPRGETPPKPKKDPPKKPPAPKPKVEPSVNPVLEAPPVVVVKRPYTSPVRQPVRLRTDSGFDGTGLFSRSSDAVDFYAAAAGGTALKFDGTDNKLAGAALSGGVTLFAEGRKASAAVDDVVLKLALSGGSKPTGPDASRKMTSVEVLLDICEPRPAGAPGADPPPLATVAAEPAAGAVPTDKFYLGRPLPVEPTTDNLLPSERAMLFVRKVKPAAFAGTLVLEAVDDKVAVFQTEAPTAGEVPLPLPHDMPTGAVPATGTKLFVQGMKPSTSARDAGLTLGLKGIEKQGDRIAVTAVYIEAVSNVETAKLKTVAVVPEKPARPSKSIYAEAPIIIGLKYDVEIRPYLEGAVASAWSWSTSSGHLTLADNAKEVIKVHGQSLSGALNDCEIELLLTMDVGRMKKKHRLTVLHVEINPVISGDNLTDADDVNIIKNPSGLVILGGGDAGDPKKVPKIEVTKLEPALGWTDDDDRIAWWVVGGDAAVGAAYPGKADFMNTEAAKRGTKIQVFGSAEGDVLIQPYSGGYGYGMFRAHVVPPTQIKYRISRIFVTAKPMVPAVGATPAVPAVIARTPTASHADAKKHVKVMNIYLRGAGIEMIPDDSAEVARPPVFGPPPARGNPIVGLAALEPKVVAVTQVENGHFDVEVTGGELTFQASNVNARSAIRLNARNEIISLAYIHSQPGNAIATALLCPANHAPQARVSPPRAYSPASYTIPDSGTPSTSLIPKTGLPGDTPAGTVKMVVLFPDVSWQGASPATSDVNLLWGIIVPTQNIDSTAPGPSVNRRILAYANTLAHEMGHVLGLGHRGSVGDPVTDTMALPANENLMHPSNPPPTAQNLDLIQVRAIRFSEALFRHP
jgi:hypothetical protein